MGLWVTPSPTTPLDQAYTRPETNTWSKVVIITTSTGHTASMIRTF